MVLAVISSQEQGSVPPALLARREDFWSHSPSQLALAFELIAQLIPAPLHPLLSPRFSSPLHSISNPHLSQINNTSRCPLVSALAVILSGLPCLSQAGTARDTSSLFCVFLVSAVSSKFRDVKRMLEKVQCGSGEPTHLH